MDVQSLITEVTGRAEKIAAQSQEVATIGFDTLKTANGIVIETVQTLAKTNGDAAVALFGEAKTSFEKASKAGAKAVIADPVAYLPVTTPAVEAFNASVKTLVDTRGELAKTFEGGYSSIKATIGGKPVAAAKKTVKAATKTTVKTVKAVAKKAKA
ncbi:MAG: hypothetical protein Q8Q73_12875 [Stagnimonas sp.]|nr:hypothetical protein [Stagnimonas sp.]